MSEKRGLTSEDVSDVTISRLAAQTSTGESKLCEQGKDESRETSGSLITRGCEHPQVEFLGSVVKTAPGH